MNKLFFAAGMLLLLIDPTVSVKDFKPAFGKWSGTLTYLDYSSGKPYSMPANITISPNSSDRRQLVFAYDYPDEPKANESDTLSISNDGRVFDDGTVVSRKKSGGVLELITEYNGKDGNDNKRATIRHTYSISRKLFTNRKEVRFEGTGQWILRNEYKMRR